MGLVAVDDVVVSGHNSVAVGLAFLLAESPSLFKLSVVVKKKKKKSSKLVSKSFDKTFGGWVGALA